MTRRTLCPSAARAGGRLPATSDSTPVLAKGTASDAANSIFIGNSQTCLNADKHGKGRTKKHGKCRLLCKSAPIGFYPCPTALTLNVFCDLRVKNCVKKPLRRVILKFESSF